MSTIKKKIKKRINPLKLDPSRTATLRRAFTAVIRRKFARIKYEIHKLLIEQDAFGLNKKLVGNVFCATGEGGGVDPTCKLTDSKTSSDPAREKSEKAAGNWVYRWRGTPGSKYLPTNLPPYPVQKILQESRPKEPITLYRMERTDHDPTKTDMSTNIPVQSWSREGESLRETVRDLNKDVDDKILEQNFKWRVLEKTFKPGEVFADFDNLPKSVKDHMEKLGSRSDSLGEVLVFHYRQARDYTGVNVVEGPRGNINQLYKTSTRNNFTTNTFWQFKTSAEQITEFQKWLRTLFTSELTGLSNEELWLEYTKQGFRKGLGRSYDDAKKAEKVLELVSGREKFFEGAKGQFLQLAFSRPVAVEKVKLLAGRSFDDLEGITSDMSTRMSRTLTDGLVQGQGARELAKNLDKEVDLGRSRAMVVARTEIIRAHAEGQLEALDQLGVEEVGVAVEWSTAGDDKVCPLCEELQGVVLKLDEARGMIPRHPNCRCSFIPANVGEKSDIQKDTQAAIKDAILSSRELGGLGDDDIGSWGEGASISKNRPESILNQEYIGPELEQFSNFLHDME